MIGAGLTVAAVGSRSQEKADAFAQKLGLPHAHPRYQDLVQDPTVDIVYVATPHPQHMSAALLALDAGKHVLIEKPFTLNAREARKLVDYAAAKKLIVLEAMWTLFLPHTRRIHEIINSGVMGTLRSVSAEHRQCLSTDPKHRVNAPELGGGALLDLGIYPISFAFDILGAPTARFKDTGVDAEVATVMHHQGGALAMTVTALDCAGQNHAVIYGTKARIVLAPPWHRPTSFRLEDYQGNVLEEYNDAVEHRGMQFQAFEMEHLVRTGTLSTILPPEESVLIMETFDTIRQQIGLTYPGKTCHELLKNGGETGI